jgi:3-isopropylmalate/(R)-2-methylmalate dehydratase small subunit
MMIRGFCWKFGDNVNTDLIFPQRYSYIIDPKELGKHAMEGIDPGFFEKVRSGDIIVAGDNFGSGSSMEHATIALKTVGVGAVVAASFARIFYRNAISLGFPVVESIEAVEEVDEGDELEISLESGRLTNLTKGSIYNFKPLPRFLIEILEKGGLIPHLKILLSQ